MKTIRYGLDYLTLIVTTWLVISLFFQFQYSNISMSQGAFIEISLPLWIILANMLILNLRAGYSMQHLGLIILNATFLLFISLIMTFYYQIYLTSTLSFHLNLVYIQTLLALFIIAYHATWLILTGSPGSGNFKSTILESGLRILTIIFILLVIYNLIQYLMLCGEYHCLLF